MLTTIALPHDWCGYGEVIAGFKAKYPEITVNELNPDAGSADELEAVRANKDNTGPQAPDVLDVGLPSARRRRPKGCCSPTRSRPGTRSPTTPRMPTATGMATITA
jgi:putative spermidine/putrescine transport system substrate-binding protein